MAFLRIYNLKSAPGRSEAMGQILRDLAVAVQSIPGSEGAEFAQDADSSDQFTFIERWADAAAWEAGKSAAPKELFKAIMEVAAEPPSARSANTCNI